MENTGFKKVINPVMVELSPKHHARAFVEIEYKQENGRMVLSLSGVIGPNRWGNCSGGAGQIVDELEKATARPSIIANNSGLGITQLKKKAPRSGGFFYFMPLSWFTPLLMLFLAL